MGATYLEAVILFCLSKINGERSVYSIFHLLKGKKSSQTIQDAHLFHLSNLFQAYLNLTREEFDVKLSNLKAMQLVKEDSDQHCWITDNGNITLMNQLNMMPFPNHLNGWRFHSMTSIFWERISLLIQVYSNLVHNNSEYLPVQRKYETQSWLKNYLFQSNKDKSVLASSLLGELNRCLKSDSSIVPAYFIIRLTGYKKIGLTSQQAANFFKLDPWYYHLLFINTLHFILEEIGRNPSLYPILFDVIKDLSKPNTFTQSTNKTFDLLKKGLSLNEVAAFRKLKLSTIEDHLVEIALIDKSLDITGIVSKDKQKMILNAASHAASKQLKHIRELLTGIEYFEIRLVLAKYGDAKWN